jgi:hypothetical protein
MPLIRLAAFLILGTIAISLLLYLFTRNPQYARFAWQTFKFAVHPRDRYRGLLFT